MRDQHALLHIPEPPEVTRRRRALAGIKHVDRQRLERRARALLEEHLDERQLRELREHGGFLVEDHEGYPWWVNATSGGRQGTAPLVDPAGWGRHIWPLFIEHIPSDTALGLKLWLEADPEHVDARACRAGYLGVPTHDGPVPTGEATRYRSTRYQPDVVAQPERTLAAAEGAARTLEAMQADVRRAMARVFTELADLEE
jgi:hypothetical protein